MSSLAEAPPQQEIETAQDGNEKTRDCCLLQCMTVETSILLSAFLVFVSIILLCVIFGPARVLEACLDFLIPPNPTWEHAFILGFLIAFLMIIPFPVVFFIMILAGLNFGFWYGFIIIVIAQPIGLCPAFLIGKNLCKEPLRQCLLGGNCPRAKAVIEALEAQKDIWLALMLFRFLPLPFAIRNYAPTMMDVSFLKLLLTALPQCIWQAILFASLGAMFKDTAEIARHEGKFDWESIRWQELFIFVGSVCGGIGCAIYATRVYYTSVPEASSTESNNAASSGDHSFRAAPSADPEEPSTICCCCDRKACCTPSFRCGICWGYFGFILIVGIILGVYTWKYGANAVSMYAIRALPDNPDLKTALILMLIVIASQVLLIPFRAIPLLLVGLFFGIWPGMAYLFAAFFSVLMICLAIGRTMGRPVVQECIQQDGWSDFRRFINVVEDDKHSMRLLVLYPFLFQPDFSRYYFPSVLAVPLWHFAVCYLPWCLWVAFVYSSLGASFRDSVELSKRQDEVTFSRLKWQQVAPPLIAVFVTPFIVWYACREYRKRVAEGDSQPINNQRS